MLLQELMENIIIESAEAAAEKGLLKVIQHGGAKFFSDAISDGDLTADQANKLAQQVKAAKQDPKKWARMLGSSALYKNMDDTTDGAPDAVKPHGLLSFRDVAAALKA